MKTSNPAEGLPALLKGAMVHQVDTAKDHQAAAIRSKEVTASSLRTAALKADTRRNRAAIHLSRAVTDEVRVDKAVIRPNKVGIHHRKADILDSSRVGTVRRLHRRGTSSLVWHAQNGDRVRFWCRVGRI